MVGSTALAERIAPLVEALGYEFWGLESRGQGKKSLLRIYIDADAGVTVDDCAKVSDQVGSLLDVEDPYSSAFTLEVSSPGMDRPLFTLDQCQRFAGSRVAVKLRQAYEGRRNYQGLMVTVEKDELVVRIEGDQELLLPFEWIERINVIPQF